MLVSPQTKAVWKTCSIFSALLCFWRELSEKMWVCVHVCLGMYTRVLHGPARYHPPGWVVNFSKPKIRYISAKDVSGDFAEMWLGRLKLGCWRAPDVQVDLLTTVPGEGEYFWPSVAAAIATSKGEHNDDAGGDVVGARG